MNVLPKPMHRTMLLLLVTILLSSSSASAQDVLRIDPMTLVALQEARNASSELELFPGWDFARAPVLLYRPGVQDVLLNHPSPPDGFIRYTGRHPLGNEVFHVRNDSTHFDLDGQNTADEVGGERVLIVADPVSTMRSQLQSLPFMPDDAREEWLANWSFLGSPYDLITTILHEGFHVYQYEQTDKFADETIITRYPLLDPVNNALHEVEGAILLAAARSDDAAFQHEALRHFAAVRMTRHARLAPDVADYEMRNEYVEGLAKYIEYRFYKDGHGLTAAPEMYLDEGFSGYGDRLAERMEEQHMFSERLFTGDIAVNNDRFGAGNLRFKLYPMGALEGLLLDAVAPSWKSRIFEPGVYQSTLLVDAAALSDADRERLVQEAKLKYGYDKAYVRRQIYENEGLEAANSQLKAILDTERTLVRISYGDIADSAPGLSFTPFGVTRLSDTRTIYTMVPIGARFSDSSRLRMNIATPVLVDQDRKEVVFAVPTSTDGFTEGDVTGVHVQDFDLTGDPMNVTIDGNEVTIALQRK